MMGGAIARMQGRGGAVLLDLGGRRRLLAIYLAIMLAAFATWLPVTALLFDLSLLVSLLAVLGLATVAALITLPIAYAGNGQLREGGVISSGAFTPWAEVLRADPWERGISLTVAGPVRSMPEASIELPCEPGLRDHALRIIRSRADRSDGTTTPPVP